MDLVENLQGFVDANLSLLTPTEQAWQPTDYLPDLTSEDWVDQLSQFRDCASRLPDDLLVVLVGNMVTEEALPNYSISLDQVTGGPDSKVDSPWAHWLRGWTSEENRHGDLLNAYLRLTGRVNMRSVERTVHHLIRNGFNPGHQNDPAAGLIYAAFQERATRMTHGNLGRIAAKSGEANLATICRKIAADETRHETFYTRVVGQIMDLDPETGILAYRTMIKGLIGMPGRKMADGHNPNLFDHYAAITQRTGVYTSRDYASIIRHLNDAWGIGRRSVAGNAAKAQDYLCRQPERYEYLADELGGRAAEQSPLPFSWIHDRQI